MKAVNLRMVEQESERNTWCTQLHPVVKLLVVLFYILMMASTDGRQLSVILSLGLLPLIWVIVADVDLILLLSQLIIPALIGAGIGIFNVVIDREIITSVVGLPITNGLIMFIGVIFKSVFSVLSTLTLVSTTKLEDLGYGLEKLKIPKTFVTVLLLVYRFLALFVEEVTQTLTAYRLRTGHTKGVHFKVWASMIGPMIIRAYDHALTVYDAMLLRGFDGVFYQSKNFKFTTKDGLFLGLSLVLILFMKGLWI